MKRPELTLECQDKDDFPFFIYVRSGAGFYGKCPFETFDGAVEAFKVAWSVFSATIKHYEELYTKGE